MTDIRIIPAQGAINVTGSVNFRGTNNSSVLFLTGSGGAGLGTASPDSELHIVGSQTRFVTLDRTGTRSYDIGINSSKTLLITDNTAEADRISLTLSGSVGIGVTNPTNQLQVYGQSSGNGTTVEIGNSYGESPKTILFTNTTADVGKIVVNGRNQAISNMPYMAFSLWNSTSTTVEEVMRINREGNVGVGITNPSANLHVSESIRIGYPTGRLYAEAGGGFYGEITPFNINGRMVFNVNYPGGNIVFQSGSQEVARFKDGYLGIGTTGPSYHLDINAGAKVPARLRSSADAQLIVEGSNTWAGIQFKDSGDSAYIWYRGSTGTFAVGGGGSTVAGKKLHTHGGATVGSGYASHVMPTNGLSVEGGVEIGGDLTIDGIVTAKEFHTTFVSASIIFSSGSTLFGDDVNDIHQFTGSIVQSGGTTTVGDKLYLTNVASSGQDGILAFDSTNTSGGSRIFSFTRGGSNELKYHSYGYHRWYSGPASGISDSTARMTLNSDGNLGIGTTAPASTLHIKEDTSTVYDATAYQKDFIIERKNTSGNNQSAHIRFLVTGYEGQTTGEASIGVIQTSNASSGHTVFTNRHNGTRSETLRIKSDGNVGIGTSNPSYALVVDSGVTNVAAAFQSSDTEVWLNLRDSDTGTANNSYGVLIGHQLSTNELLKIADSSVNTKFLIKTDGNVGIGTTAPKATLDVAGSSNEGIRIGSGNAFLGATSGGTGADTQLIYWNGTHAYYGRYTTGYTGKVMSHSFRANGSTKLFVTSSGVHIGSTTGADAPLLVKSNGSSADQISLEHSGNTVKLVSLGQLSSHGSIHIRQNNGQEKIRLQASGSSYINTGFNVGVGTTSPASNFHIYGNASNLVRIESTNGEADIYFTSGISGGTNWQVGTGYPSAPGGAGTFFFYQGGATKFAVKTSGGFSAPMYGSGNFTGTPAYRLSVDSSGNIIEESIGAGAIDGAGQANRLAKWVDSDTLTSSSINVSADNKTVDHYSYQNLAQLNIGRTSAERVNLYVDDNDIIFTATQDSDGNAAHQFIMDRQFDGTGANTFEIHKDSSAQVIVDGDGDVLIGQTTTTSDKLQVTGENNKYAVRVNGGLGGSQSYGLRVRAGTSNSDASMLIENTSGTDLFVVKGDGNVGINTYSAAAKLHIVGDGWEDNTVGSNLLRLESTDTIGAGIALKNSSGGYWNMYHGDTASWVGKGGLGFVYASGSAASGPKVTFTSTGNVGIGVTNPSVKLQVASGGIRATGTTSTTGQIDASPNYGAFRFYDGSTFLGGLGTGQWASVGGTGDSIMYLAVNRAFHVSNTTTARLTVTSAGDVGLSQTSPRERLEVNGQALLNSALFQRSQTDHTDISTSNEYINHIGPVRIEGSGANINQYGTFKGYQAVYGSGSHGWDAYTQGAYAHPILEYYSGNNGSHPFPAGSAFSSGYLYQFVKGPDWSGGGAGTPITSSNSELVWGITNDKYGYFANRIGIGTDSPSEELHVEGGVMKVTGGTNNGKYSQFYVNDSWAYFTTNVSKYYLNAELRVDGGQIGSYNEDLFLRTSGNTKVTIQDVTGNVGIGTTDPTGSLHIATGGDANDSAILIEVDDTKYRKIQFSEDYPSWGPDQYGAYVGYDASGNVFSIGTYNSGTDKRTLNIPRGSNRVGIGITSPSYALEVTGEGDNVIAAFQSTDNRASIRIDDNDTTSYIGTEDGLLYFNRGTGNGISSAISNGMLIDGNGNVGIGTSNVDARLHISSSIPNAIRIETEEHGETTPQLYIEGNKSGGAPALGTAIEIKSNTDYRGRGILFTLADSTTEWYAGVPYAGSGFQIGYDATGKQLPYYSTSSSLFINNYGNVGIGTNNPSNTLHVENTGNGSVVRVTNAQNSFYLGNDTNGGYLQPASTGMAMYGPNGTKYVFVNNTGVGIGTTSPTQTLEVNGNALVDNLYLGSTTTRLSTNGSGELGINYNNSATSTYGFSVYNGSTTRVFGVKRATGDVEMNGDLTVDGTITAKEFHTTFVSASIVFQSGSTQFGNSSDDIHEFTGNVGIGIGNPVKPLHIYSANDAPLRVESSDSTTGILFADPDNNNALYYVGSGNYFYTTSELRANTLKATDSDTAGVFQLAYADQHKKEWTTSLSFSFTAAGTYNFNLVFRNSGGYHYDLVATTDRNGTYRNFGTLKDSSHIYWESDGDFAHRAEGDVHLVSNYQNGMYFSADTTSFLSDSKTGTSQNGSSNWSYYIVRYSIYIPYYVGAATGVWKLHLTTYGDTGNNSPEFVLA